MENQAKETYVIYLVIRVFYDDNHPKTDSTSPDDRNLYCSPKWEYEQQLENKASNVDAYILHEFEAFPSELVAYLNDWYAKWDDPAKPEIGNCLLEGKEVPAT
jgi:hypothetical protein